VNVGGLEIRKRRSVIKMLLGGGGGKTSRVLARKHRGSIKGYGTKERYPQRRNTGGQKRVVVLH